MKMFISETDFKKVTREAIIKLILETKNELRACGKAIPILRERNY